MRMSDAQENYHTRETLLEKIKNQHDDASWEDFVFYYKHYIYIICRRMNLQHHDAEEVVQKVLLKVWNSLPGFEYDKRRRFRGWLCQVTGNCVRDLYRHAKRQSTKIENAANDESYNPTDKVTLPDIEIIAEKEWETYIANMAMDNIRPKFSAKVIEIFLKLSEGKLPKDISEEMDVPANTVAVYKKRVTAKLCEEIRRLNIELGG
jgi:RNA polymerase sigma factor (sigma-70 family)